MPRPNPERSFTSEAALALRIKWERESTGMTYEGLAKRMTDAGCPIQGSAIYKIEKGDPPRRITVNELVAFAQVFGVAVEDLLVPLELLKNQKAKALVDDLMTSLREVEHADYKADLARIAVVELISEHAELRDLVYAMVEEEYARQNVVAPRRRAKILLETVEQNAPQLRSKVRHPSKAHLWPDEIRRGNGERQEEG